MGEQEAPVTAALVTPHGDGMLNAAEVISWNEWWLDSTEVYIRTTTTLKTPWHSWLVIRILCQVWSNVSAASPRYDLFSAGSKYFLQIKYLQSWHQNNAPWWRISWQFLLYCGTDLQEIYQNWFEIDETRCMVSWIFKWYKYDSDWVGSSLAHSRPRHWWRGLSTGLFKQLAVNHRTYTAHI